VFDIVGVQEIIRYAMVCYQYLYSLPNFHSFQKILLMASFHIRRPKRQENAYEELRDLRAIQNSATPGERKMSPGVIVIFPAAPIAVPGRNEVGTQSQRPTRAMNSDIQTTALLDVIE
jgi:hypothetical protein